MLPLHRAIHAPFRLTPLLVALFLLPLTAACGENRGALDVEQIVERVVEAQSEITSVHQVADLSVEMDPNSESGIGAIGTMTMTIESWTDGPKTRMEWQGDSPILGGTVMLSDGKTVQSYMPEMKQVFEASVPTLDGGTVSPEQSALMTREWVTQLIRRTDIELVGIEEVAGRMAFKLEARPKTGAQDADGAAEALGGTVWIDAERFYPLKLDMPMGWMHMRMTVREIEYNPTIPAERFVLDLPADVEKSELSIPSMATTTAGDAADKVGFALLAIDPSESEFQLESTQVIEIPGSGEEAGGLVMQTYTGPAGTVIVQQMRVLADGPDMAAAMSGLDQAREVRVGDHAATLVSLGLAGSTLSWQTDETLVTLSGDLSEEELLAFAALLR